MKHFIKKLLFTYLLAICFATNTLTLYKPSQYEAIFDQVKKLLTSNQWTYHELKHALENKSLNLAVNPCKHKHHLLELIHATQKKHPDKANEIALLISELSRCLTGNAEEKFVFETTQKLFYYPAAQQGLENPSLHHFLHKKIDCQEYHKNLNIIITSVKKNSAKILKNLFYNRPSHPSN